MRFGEFSCSVIDVVSFCLIIAVLNLSEIKGNVTYVELNKNSTSLYYLLEAENESEFFQVRCDQNSSSDSCSTASWIVEILSNGSATVFFSGLTPGTGYQFNLSVDYSLNDTATNSTESILLSSCTRPSQPSEVEPEQLTSNSKQFNITIIPRNGSLWDFFTLRLLQDNSTIDTWNSTGSGTLVNVPEGGYNYTVEIVSAIVCYESEIVDSRSLLFNLLAKSAENEEDDAAKTIFIFIGVLIIITTVAAVFVVALRRHANCGSSEEPPDTSGTCPTSESNNHSNYYASNEAYDYCEMNYYSTPYRSRVDSDIDISDRNVNSVTGTLAYIDTADAEMSHDSHDNYDYADQND